MDGKFKKGKSGNPGGRPRIDPEIVETCKALSGEAVERLAHWMRSDNPKASPSASVIIMDRAYGKPAQALTVGGDANNPIKMTIEWQEK